MDWATSLASSSGRLISLMFTWICLPVSRFSSRRSASTSDPLLPITMPGTGREDVHGELGLVLLQVDRRQAGVAQLAGDVVAHGAVLVEVLRELALSRTSCCASRCAGGRGGSRRVDLLTHVFLAPVSARPMVMWQVRFVDRGRAAHGPWTEALDGRPLVHGHADDAQLAHVEAVVVVGVGDGRLQHLAHRHGRRAGAVGQDRLGVRDRLAADRGRRPAAPLRAEVRTNLRGRLDDLRGLRARRCSSAHRGGAVGAGVAPVGAGGRELAQLVARPCSR